MNDENIIQKLKADLLSKSKNSAADEPKVHSNIDIKDSLNLEHYKDFETLNRLTDYFNKQGDDSIANPYFMPRSSAIDDHVTVNGEPHLTFSNYNYLGMSADPMVHDAAISAIRQYGTGAGAARMVGGEIEIHQRLEKEFAEFTGHEAAVASVGGYGTNLSCISYLLGQGDLVIHDEYMHNSGLMGCVLSGARRIVFPHCDYSALDKLLSDNRHRYKRALILVESAYSMDGDLVDLQEVIRLKEKYHCWLMIDEAHSYGTLGKTGRGICEHFDIDPRKVDISMGTFSKSFASCGGFIAGSKDLIDLIRYFAPGFLLYSVGLSPPNCAAALASLRLLIKQPQRVEDLQKNAKEFLSIAKQKQLDTGPAMPGVPIIPIIIGDSDLAFNIMLKLAAQGIIAHAVIYPVVPDGEARLRFFITNQHRYEQFETVLEKIKGYLS